MSETPTSEPITTTVTPGSPDAPAVGALAVEALAFERGAIGGVRATDVTARLAMVGGVAANHVSIEMGAATGIVAREVTVHQGIVRGVLAQSAHVEQALVRSVVANTMHAGPSTGIVFAVARQIDGEARILLDWRGALAFGAGLGAFVALIRLARR